MDRAQTHDDSNVVTAKVLIVGDSGVGKSGLAGRLDANTFQPTASTHGASFSHIIVSPEVLGDSTGSSRAVEIDVWDLGGQPDYNVIHQLFMDGSHAALIVIDESREDALSSIPHWAQLIDERCPDLHSKLLVSARTDRGGPQFDSNLIESCLSSIRATAFVRTSAVNGRGIADLTSALIRSIDWSRLPRGMMPAHWREAEQLIHSLEKGDARLLAVEDIERRFGSSAITRPETLMIMNLMHQRGQVFLLQPRDDSYFVLLDPSLLNRYGSSILLAARSNAGQPGTISEAAVLRGKLDLVGFERLPVPEERIVLDSVVALLLRAGACNRNQGRLEFPSQVLGPVIRCFLSHNSADKPVAEELGRRLLDKGIDVWLDKWEILAGESLTSRIAEGIDGASAFIILMSPRSMKAKWVKEELRIALQRRLDDPGFALIPVLLEDCEISAFLRDYVYVDWRTQNEESFDFLLRSLRGTKRKPQVI